MKRLCHYALLAAVLLGVPLACAVWGGHADLLEGVKAFPPRTEDWGFRPELLWNHRCPFNWWIFSGLVLFTFACLWPFLKRMVRVMRGEKGEKGERGEKGEKGERGEKGEKSEKRTLPWWGWAGLVVLFVGWHLSWSRYAWFAAYQIQCSYFPMWMGFILFMNALCVKRSGHSPMTDHPWAYAATFPASSLFWWFFEYLNRYVWNWYYLGVSEMSATAYTVYATICFASVLPAVTVVAAWLKTFRVFDDRVYSDMARVDLRRPGWCAFLLVGSVLGLTGIVFFPQYAYPLIWISPLMVFVLVQFLLKEPSVLDSFAAGNWSVFIRFACASLICGFCWETWNWHAYAKWVYAVPWAHRFQIWEMPLIGFAGYLPFGVECAAVTAWISPRLLASDVRF